MWKSIVLVLCVGTLAIAGCSRGTGNNDVAKLVPSTEGMRYLLQDQPKGAKDVIDVRQNAKNDDTVLVTGRIGGEEDPWTEDLAAFSIVDKSLRACSDIPGDECPIPWDYCCETDLAASTALIKIVDADGNVIQTDARKLLGVRELSTVIVAGKAQRDDDGNLTVLASAIYVKEL